MTVLSKPQSNRNRGRRTAAPLAVASAAGALWLAATDARGAQYYFTSGSSLTTANNYAVNGATATVAPSTGDNVVFNTSSPGTAGTITANTLSIQDITFNTATSTTISNTTSTTTASTLQLNGGRTSYLIDENSTKTLTIKNGTTGALNIVLGAGGAFELDNSGGLTISSNIGEVNPGTTLTITGAGSGAVALSGTDSFTGGLVVTGAEVDVTGDASLGAAGGSITINGGRLGFQTNNTTIDPTRNFYLGPNPTGGNTTGTLSIKGTITVTENAPLQNLPGYSGDLVKQGGGTLVLGGASTYTGNTFLNNGITQITGNNRLPTTTTLNLGQAASTNLGSFDLNGFNQQVAGLNSTTGTGTSGANNISSSVSGTVATLTLGGSGTYSYGSAAANNSAGIIGPVAINKTGTGTQAFGQSNSYTGGTSISGGVLLANAIAATGFGTVSILSGGTLAGNGGVASVNVSSGGTVTAGSGATASASLGTFNVGSATLAGGTYAVKLSGATSDELLLTGLATANGSTGQLTVSPVVVGSTTATSYVIADDPTNLAAFDSLINSGQVLLSPAAYAAGDTLTTAGDGSGGEDLILNLTTATPEPTSLLLLGLTAAPLALRRRRL
jgi:fibronectin-binding autotransporter adhesin